MRLLFVGDVMLGRLVNEDLRGRPPWHPWGDTLKAFESADLRFCNLECVISDHGAPWSITPKVFHFRTDAKNVGVLKAAGIDAVSLANNHTLDYEYEAAFEMLTVLEREGIAYAGFGRDLNEAARPAIVTVKGKKAAFISFTDNEPGWTARENEPGVFYLPVDPEDSRAKMLFNVVREAKDQADIVIVAAHWGPNWGYRPVDAHIPFAHDLVDNGADIIFGHSCHVFQGIEVYKGRPIIYSAGDFIDDYAVDEMERNDESFIFTADFDGGFKGMTLHPAVIDDFHAALASRTRGGKIASRMVKLCSEFGTKAGFDEEDNKIEISV